MKTAYVFFANGFEEVEALAPVDVLRRAGLDVKMIAVSTTKQVIGAHGVYLLCDATIKETTFLEEATYILPGGMPGAQGLKDSKELADLLCRVAGKTYIAAICAAPMVLGGLQLLKGKKATCYPGFESYLEGANVVADKVVVDGLFITGKGPGAALEFALTILAQLTSPAEAEELRKGMIVSYG